MQNKFTCIVFPVEFGLYSVTISIYTISILKKSLIKYQSNNFPMQIRQEIHNGFIFYIPDVCTTAENKKGR